MTQLRGNTIIIGKEEPQKCQYCGEIKETRPYGPNGDNICFDCAHATPEMEQISKENMKKRMLNLIKGAKHDN